MTDLERVFSGISEPWTVLDKYDITCESDDPDEWEMMLLKAQKTLARVQGDLVVFQVYGGNADEAVTLLKENVVLTRYVDYYKDHEPAPAQSGSGEAGRPNAA